jgi:hypothetical protein
VNEDMAMTVLAFLTRFAGPSATPSITGQRAKDISRRHPYRAQLEANLLQSLFAVNNYPRITDGETKGAKVNAPMRPSARSALLLSTDIVSLAGHVR